MAKTESLGIPCPSGLRLSGVMHHPEQGPTTSCVVVAHGMLSSKESDKHRMICEAAASAGTLALRFDFRGRGDSDGDPSILTVSNEIEDLTAAVEFARHCGCARVIVVGSSLGGTVAILSGAADREFAGLVTIAAPSQLPERPRQAWGGRGRRHPSGLIEVAPGEWIGDGFFRDCGRHDVIAAARTVSCPWLIIHGAADPVVRVADADLLAGAAPNASLMVHPNAGHRFDQSEERDWLIQRVADFIASRL